MWTACGQINLIIMAHQNPGKISLRFMDPLEQILPDGMLCTRREGRTYPPFIDPGQVEHLSNTWDTDAHDVFICTHQKVGTHLTKKFVVEILRSLVAYPMGHPIAEGDIGHGTVPWPEVLVSQHGMDYFFEYLHQTAGLPRVWYTHCCGVDLPFRHIHPGSKFIFVVRDPKSVVVSQYFFYKSHPMLSLPPAMDLSSFVDLFITGNLYFGDYHYHALDWISCCGARINREQILVLRYEELVEAKEAVVERLSRFLIPEGCLSPEQTRHIAQSTEFHHMKKDISDNPRSFHFNPATFFRAGTTRDWEAHLSDAEAARMDEKSRQIWGEGCESSPDLSGIPNLLL